ncbi:MAG: hypothetical protein WAO74_06405 [Polaribacter sp.]|uniref:hypothetical protein n=1 Tax=Polaribacter sp. TaxID=1920175 RepID=UPI003BB1ECD5
MHASPITQLEQLTLNTSAKSFLRETAKWSFFLAIIGFIGIALMALLGIFSSVVFANLPFAQTQNLPFNIGTMMTLIYLVLSVLYFFPVYYLLQFSVKMKKALSTKNDEVLADAFEKLKSHYKFIGVFTIIFLSLYVLIIVAALMGALA